ncbi:MAG: hypothetical protein QXQ43_03710 [Nitrososphaerota archaeon]
MLGVLEDIFVANELQHKRSLKYGHFWKRLQMNSYGSKTVFYVSSTSRFNKTRSNFEMEFNLGSINPITTDSNRLNDNINRENIVHNVEYTSQELQESESTSHPRTPRPLSEESEGGE